MAKISHETKVYRVYTFAVSRGAPLWVNDRQTKTDRKPNNKNVRALLFFLFCSFQFLYIYSSMLTSGMGQFYGSILSAHTNPNIYTVVECAGIIRKCGRHRRDDVCRALRCCARWRWRRALRRYVYGLVPIITAQYTCAHRWAHVYPTAYMVYCSIMM